MTKTVHQQTNESADPFSRSHHLADLGKHHLDTLIRAQSQFLRDAEEMNRTWTSRVESEVALISALFTKLASAKTLPDTLSAYQECLSDHLQLLSQDSARIYEGAGKFLASSAHLFSNGRSGVTT